MAFTDEPGVTRILWLFSLVLGSSRWLWARFVLHQDLQTVLRYHIAAFADTVDQTRYDFPDRAADVTGCGNTVYFC